MKSIDIPCAHIELIEKNIIRILYRDQYELTIHDMKELDQTLMILIPEGKVHLIINTEERYFTMSKEVQKYFASDSPMIERIGCTAIIINNLANRLIGKFFISNYSPVYPTKIFKTENEAYKWTKEIITG